MSGSRSRKGTADEPVVVIDQDVLDRWASAPDNATQVSGPGSDDGEGGSGQGERGRHPKSGLPEPSGQRSWVCPGCGASHRLVVPILHCHVCGRRR